MFELINTRQIEKPFRTTEWKELGIYCQIRVSAASTPRPRDIISALSEIRLPGRGNVLFVPQFECSLYLL